MMEHSVLHLGRWHIDFLFADEEYDLKTVVGYLYDANAPYSAMRKSVNLMQEGEMNTGFTFNNPVDKRIVVVIGPTDSSEEFINTLVHELHHVAVAIADHNGFDLDGETPAYIAGGAAKELARIICRRGCPSCKD